LEKRGLTAEEEVGPALPVAGLVGAHEEIFGPSPFTSPAPATTQPKCPAASIPSRMARGGVGVDVWSDDCDGGAVFDNVQVTSY